MIEQNQGDCKGLQTVARALVVAIVALVVAFLVGVFWAGRASAETPDRVQVGVTSWYGYGPVACPGRHSPAQTGESRPGVGPMTAAHKSLPCGTRVRVTTRDRSGTVRSAILTITDRGPYVRGRIIDVSPDAARVLGLISPGSSTRGPGILPVTVEVQ
jgi:rare lipoprotein A (peptidoglycan hydrolase)